MVQIGKHNKLEVVKEVGFGVYLNGGEYDEILLPKKYMPEECEVGQMVDVFVYLDSEDIVITTTLKPCAEVGQFVYMKVVSVEPVGAFLDWGLAKDLLVPFAEQMEKMTKENSYIVYVYIDSVTDRIVASSKIAKFIKSDTKGYKEAQEVELLIWEKTQIGYKAIINGVHEGLIFEEDVFQPIQVGQKVTGYVKQVREDGKVDLLLSPPGFKQIDVLSQQIFTLLQESEGFLPLSNNSSPEAISKMFSVSKKSFKKAVGALYKRRLISVDTDGIRIVKGRDLKE